MVFTDDSGFAADAVDSRLDIRDVSGSPSILMAHLVVWLLILISGTFVSIRISAKIIANDRLWFDDTFLIAAWAIAFFYGISSSTALGLGLGTNPDNFDKGTIKSLGLFSNISATLAITASIWAKTSLIITLMRMNKVARSQIRWVIWFIIIFTYLVLGAVVLSVWLKCTPVSKAWDDSLHGTCWPKKTAFIIDISGQAFSGFVDLVSAGLGCKVVWDVQLKLVEITGVGFTISMIILASATAFVTCGYEAAQANGDDTIGAIRVLMWGIMEPAVLIMAASIPAFRHFINRPRQEEEAGTSVSGNFEPNGILTRQNSVCPTARETPPPRPARPTSSQSWWTNDSLAKPDTALSPVPPQDSSESLIKVDKGNNATMRVSPISATDNYYQPFESYHDAAITPTNKSFRQSSTFRQPVSRSNSRSKNYQQPRDNRMSRHDNSQQPRNNTYNRPDNYRPDNYRPPRNNNRPHNSHIRSNANNSGNLYNVPENKLKPIQLLPGNKRLTPLEEEGLGTPLGWFGHARARMGGSKDSVTDFIDTYGSRAAGVLKQMDLIVPLAQQRTKTPGRKSLPVQPSSMSRQYMNNNYL